MRTRHLGTAAKLCIGAASMAATIAVFTSTALAASGPTMDAVVADLGVFHQQPINTPTTTTFQNGNTGRSCTFTWSYGNIFGQAYAKMSLSSGTCDVGPGTPGTHESSAVAVFEGSNPQADVVWVSARNKTFQAQLAGNVSEAAFLVCFTGTTPRDCVRFEVTPF
jgi:hypothetical protein